MSDPIGKILTPARKALLVRLWQGACPQWLNVPEKRIAKKLFDAGFIEKVWMFDKQWAYRVTTDGAKCAREVTCGEYL